MRIAQFLPVELTKSLRPSQLLRRGVALVPDWLRLSPLVRGRDPVRVILGLLGVPQDSLPGVDVVVLVLYADLERDSTGFLAILLHYNSTTKFKCAWKRRS